MKGIFTEDFAETPFWWTGWDPRKSEYGRHLVPADSEVVVVGGGYAGLSCALELASHGKQVTVLDAQVPGIGASTRNGGQVTGGVNVGKTPSGAAGSPLWLQRQAALLTEASDAYRLFEGLVDKHRIDCGYRRNGRLTAAWTTEHVDSWRRRLDQLNSLTGTGAYVMTKAQMREEIASEIYAGGIFVARAGYIDPALFLQGMLRAAVDSGAIVCGEAAVSSVKRHGIGYRVSTRRGNIDCRQVVIATNGYTGDATPQLRRLVVPVTSHSIATEELPDDLAKSLLPRQRAVAETRRVINYFRMSTDGRRLLFGGRARFYPLSARQSATVLHAQMVQRFPQLADVKVSHSWGGEVALTFDFLPHISRHEGMYYALGCNGSGVTMMTYLGHRIARALIERQDVTVSAYGTPAPQHVLYRGTTWFMPMIGSLYQIQDAADLRREHRKRAKQGLGT